MELNELHIVDLDIGNTAAVSEFVGLFKRYNQNLHTSADEAELDAWIASILWRMKESDRWLLIAKVAARGAIGFSFFKIDKDERKGLGYIMEFYVDPEFRKRDLGRQLAQRSCEVLCTSGVGQVWLASNPSAEGFWTKCGFRPTAETERGQKVMIKTVAGQSGISEREMVMTIADTNSVHFRDADLALRQRIVAKLNVPGRHRLGPSTIHLDDGFTIVAMNEEEPIGVISVCWKMLRDPVPQTREAFIDLIDVDPEFRRRGIARKLVDIAAIRATEAGAYQMRAWTSNDRPAALALWRAIGFVLCPTVVLAGQEERRVYGCFVARRLGSS